ncbi:hypothetical protein OH492_20460 [Vibrio chagasii]|nr:hypothetical protein [Vibrio chagasii]
MHTATVVTASKEGGVDDGTTRRKISSAAIDGDNNDIRGVVFAETVIVR